MKPNFSGYATKYGLLCSDGRTIEAHAFKHQDRVRVPLVWRHNVDTPENILGHVELEHREDGVYAYGFLNETPNGLHSKAMIEHGDIESLSIKAVRLKQRGSFVEHGDLTEVSLVMNGANPGALIDNIYLEHEDGRVEEVDTEAIIYTGLGLEHEDKPEAEDKPKDEKTVKEVFDSLTEEQKDVVYYLIGRTSEENSAEHSDEDDETFEHDEKGSPMTRNVFDQDGGSDKTLTNTLTHEQVQQVFSDAERVGSLKESVLAHAEAYGITNIEELFPNAKDVRNTPEWIRRDQSWVRGIINGVHSTPFARIKSTSADLTHEEARAKGYIKGNLKKEQFFEISKRETTPKTIYKKQKLDRDDMVDVADFDVVAWIKGEMRFMLEEEIARAILIGDGREADDEDKISEQNLRPIAKDDEFYTHRVEVPAYLTAKNLVEAILRSRRHYKGVGNPTLYTTEDVITDLLLEEDKVGRRYYESEEHLARALRVSSIVPVEVLEDEPNLVGILVNINDYTVGADRGGKTEMFDDFDIDYNQHKWLIETRISGALTKHKTAVAIWRTEGVEVVPEAPTKSGTNQVSIPNVTGVDYFVDGGDDPVTGSVEITSPGPLRIQAVPKDGYFFPVNITRNWNFPWENDQE